MSTRRGFMLSLLLLPGMILPAHARDGVEDLLEKLKQPHHYLIMRHAIAPGTGGSGRV